MDLSQNLEIATCTDPGMVRSHNEDSIAADPANGLVVLADGMGGYNAGEVASGMATTVIITEMRQILASAKPYDVDSRTSEEIAARLVREQVLKANSSIYQAAQSQPQYAGMGTTLVVCLYYDNRDGRAPRRLALVRAARRQVEPGDARPFAAAGADRLGHHHPEQAKKAQHKNLVTKALGIDPTVEPEIHEYETQRGRHLPAVLGRPVRHGRGRGHRHDAADAGRQPRSSPRSSSCRWPTTTGVGTTFRLYWSASPSRSGYPGWLARFMARCSAGYK